MDVRAKLKDMEDRNAEASQWRRHIHAHPETAFEEVLTSDYVAGLLESWGVEIHRGMAKTAVVGTIRGKTDTRGRAVALRADMDALNILEETKVAHRSKHAGKMHACGHDGHTAMLLAAAQELAAARDFDGTVYAVFQPAEEGAGGGRVMVEEGFFSKFPCQAVFGMHNWPTLPAGVMAICEGPMTAATDLFRVEVRGRGGHAAFPHNTVDIVTCAAAIVTALQTLVSRNTDPSDPAVVSVCKFQAGTESLNVLPETAALGGTVRCFRPETRRMLEEGLRRIVRSVAEAWGATGEVEWKPGYPSVVNSPTETQLARAAAAAVVGAENVLPFTPTMGGEDFAYFLQKSPGAYIALGQGREDGSPHSHGLHSPHYDFNDDVLPVGAAYWVKLAQMFLSR